MKNLTNQGLLSLTMALVMLAPVQPPLIAAPPVAARPGEHGSPLRRAGIAAQVAAALPGQSITMLPDGSTLVLGGLTAAGSAGRALLNGQVLSKGLQHARAYHTATVLPDGTVFIFGGSDGNALITQAELRSIWAISDSVPAQGLKGII